MKTASATLASLALAAIPLALVIEKTAPETWNKGLAIVDPVSEFNRHTPLQTEGTVLAPRLTKDTTLTPEHNPVILPNATEIVPGVTLTLTPGVHLYAHEFAELSVFGTLHIQGSEAQPIILTTNERHPVNQLWNGIIIRDGGQTQITHAEFHYASPALTCEKGSQGSLTQSEIHEALIGIFTNSLACTFSDNRIQTIHDEIVSKF